MTFEQGRKGGNAPQAKPDAVAALLARVAAARLAVRGHLAAHDGFDLLDAALDAAAIGAANVAGRAAESRAITWQEKTPVDFVSEVDTTTESLVRDRLTARTPGAVVIGEELSPADAAGAGEGTARQALGVLPAHGVAFVVDPLDGTTNFLHGYPEYAVSIGAARDGRLVAGVVVNAATGETFCALAAGGAWRDGARIAVSPITEPARALVGTGLPFKHPEQIAGYLRGLDRVIRATSGVRRAGAAALDLADVACGRFECFWELSLAPWDLAAGLLLVREAGGIVTDLQGKEAVVDFTGLVAGNPAMHEWLLRTLNAER